MPGSEDPSCVGRNSWPNNAGTNCCYAGVPWARRTKHCDKLCSCCDGAPVPAPCPVPRGLTAPMRALAQKEGELQRMQAWAGQSAALAKAEPAANVLTQIWEQAQALLP